MRVESGGRRGWLWSREEIRQLFDSLAWRRLVHAEDADSRLKCLFRGVRRVGRLWFGRTAPARLRPRQLR
jgi:hypothetical protein